MPHCAAPYPNVRHYTIELQVCAVLVLDGLGYPADSGLFISFTASALSVPAFGYSTLVNAAAIKPRHCCQCGLPLLCSLRVLRPVPAIPGGSSQPFSGCTIYLSTQAMGKP